jgi:hypothetical protein
VKRTVDAGPALLGSGGALLVVALFLSWFDDVNAWGAFESLDLVLLALGAAAVAVALGRAGEDKRVGVAIAATAFVIVGVQILDPPPVVGDGADIGVGAWLGFVATLLMAGGAAQRFARFTLSLDVQRREPHDPVLPPREPVAQPKPKPKPKPKPEPEPEPTARVPKSARLLPDEDPQRTEAMSTVEIPEDRDDAG